MSVSLSGISKSYGETEALKNVSIDFPEGKTTVLIGPSGCGKSTLIRIIIGLINHDSGSVIINNKNLTDYQVHKLRREFGYVIQGGGLFPHLTAKENVTLLVKHIGWENDKINKRVKNLTELTKFPAEGLDKFPAELSGGQQQRVSLMRSLMPDPQFMLMDEPLGALDPLIRFDLQEDLKEIFSSLKKTVILVTHDLNEAAFFGDKIVLMRNGEVVQTGSISSFINDPVDEFVQKFVNAQRSMIEGDIN